MLWVALHFPSLPPGALETIAAWSCRFTPRVSLEPPRALLLEVQGSLRLFGGRTGLLQALRCGLQDIGFEAQLGTASTARAALWLARSGETKLDHVPLQAACEPQVFAFLQSVGLVTLREVMRLPREGLARRCGQAWLDDLDRALGVVPEPRDFFEPPPRFGARLELAAPVVHAEGVLFAARRLLVQLEGLLSARQSGVHEFTLALIHEDGESPMQIALASPARAVERLAALLRERLMRIHLSQPVQAIRLEAEAFVPLEARSGGIFGDAAAEMEGWAQLLERLRARLGHEAVSGLTTQPDHRPEHAWRRVEPGEWDPREYRSPGPRPLWLLEPRKLQEGCFDLLAGPERIESGWWDGDETRRDYFVARLPQAALGWVYREGGEWFLHGLFA